MSNPHISTGQIGKSRVDKDQDYFRTVFDPFFEWSFVRALLYNETFSDRE